MDYHLLLDIGTILLFAYALVRQWHKAKTRVSLEQELVALKKESLHHQLILNTAPSAIFVTNEALDLILVNESFAELFGMTPNVMLGHSLIDYIQNEATISQIKLDTQVVLQKNHTVHGGELAIKNVVGEIRTFVLSRSIIRNGIVGVITVANDITSLKRTLEALRETQEHYAKLVESSSNLILQVSPNMLITYANATSKKHLGLTPNECLGLEWTDIIVESDRDKLKRQFSRWSSWATRSEERWECDVITRLGKPKTMLWDIMIIWRGDTFMGLQLSGVDITTKRQQEIELHLTQTKLKEANLNLLHEQKQYQELLEIYEKMVRSTLKTNVNT